MTITSSVLSSVLSSQGVSDADVIEMPSTHVIEAMGQRHGFSSVGAFQRVWKEIGESIWAPEVPLTAGTLRAIDKAFEKHMVYHGPGVKAPEFASPQQDNLVRQVIRALLHGGKLSMQDLMERRLLRAVLLRKDEAFMQQFRVELQSELDHLCLQPPQNEQEELIWRAFLGHVLSLLPFAYPTEKDVVRIPCLIGNTCRSVRYDVEVIPLTSRRMSTPLMAIGLTPCEDAEAAPILSFIGTTYPAGEGFAATIIADFTPGFSVGHAAYKSGRHKIDAWMQDKAGIWVVGVSLGGALAFHALRHQHDKLARVDVYNPPGLYARDWKRQFNDGCDINIYCQAGDFVSQMGAFPTGDKVSLFQVVPHHEGVSEDWRNSHARAFTGCEKVTVLAQDPKEVNGQLYRRVLTVLHSVVGPMIGLGACAGLLLYKASSSLKKMVRELRQGTLCA